MKTNTSKTTFNGEVEATSDKKEDGSLERIPTVIKSDTPFPIPLSVMRSPNQTANIDPATITDTDVTHHKVVCSAGNAPGIDDAYNVM